MSDGLTLGRLATHFALLSFVGFGGANTILPEVYRLAVDRYGWVSGDQFVELFGIAQAAPGPNILIVALIGWKAAGVVGAGVATLATTLPSSLLAFAAARVWDRFREARWRGWVQRGLAPVTVALVFAVAWLLAGRAVAGFGTAAVAAGAGAGALLTRLNPLWFLAAAAALGALGLA